MLNTELYRHWAAERLDVSVDTVSDVHFSSYIAEGSSDLASDSFSTFAGCEVWSASVRMADGRVRSLRLWDSSPVWHLTEYARAHGHTIEFANEPESAEARLERAIRER